MVKVRPNSYEPYGKRRPTWQPFCGIGLRVVCGRKCRFQLICANKIPCLACHVTNTAIPVELSISAEREVPDSACKHGLCAENVLHKSTVLVKYSDLPRSPIGLERKKSNSGECFELY